MLSSIKASVFFAIAHAGLVEWLGYGFVFIAFLLVLFIAIFISLRWWWQIGFLVIVAGFGGFFYGIYAMHEFLASRLYSVSISDISARNLQYSDTLLVEFDIKNEGKKPLLGCQVYFSFYYPSSQPIKDTLNSLRPFKTHVIEILSPIPPDDSEHIVRTIKGFSATEYGVKKRVECY